MSCCEKKCSNCADPCCSSCPNCYGISLVQLNDLLYATKMKISEFSCSFLDALKYGRECTNLDKKQYVQLLCYQDSIEKYKDALYHGYEPCICAEDFQLTIEKTKDIVDMQCCSAPGRADVIEDRSEFDQWLVSNPTCVAYEEWEKALYQICPVLELKVEDISSLTEISYIVSSVYKGEAPDLDEKGNIINQDLLSEDYDALRIMYAIQSYQMSKDSCEVDFNITTVPQDCSLSLNVYTSLIECGMSHEVIVTLQDCGVDVSFDVETQCPMITYNSVTTSLCDFSMTTEAIENICSIVPGLTVNESDPEC